MERDKFIAQGEKFGLEGDKLRAYVDGCVREARDERAAARNAEIEARNAEIEARKAESYIIAQQDEARKKESELLDKRIKLEELRKNNGTENVSRAGHSHKPSIPPLPSLADQFNEAHADIRIRRMNKAHQSSSKNVNPNVNKSNNNAISHTKSEKPGKSKFDDKKCFNCNKFGHISFNCPNKKGRREMGASVVAGRSAEDTSAGDDAAAGPTDTREMAGHFNHKSLSLIVQENLTEDGSGVKLASGDTLPVLSAVASGSEVEMPVVDGLVNGKPVDVLRDSGCTTVIVRYELVREEQFFGDRLTCLLVDRTLRNFRRAKIDIDTPYFKGKVEALCVPTPVYDLVLGNIPGARQPADPDGDWTPGDHQGSAVETRGQKRQAGRTRPPLPVPKPLEDIVSVDNLIQAQKEDSSLDASRKAAEKGEKKIRVEIHLAFSLRRMYSIGNTWMQPQGQMFCYKLSCPPSSEIKS
ncbi:uncharacterized protein LOC121414492 [Lytechinus variegatus]|uniref:uncharacterized protein LOC121414492 n=1 Tax=Lytechinus variegatus TaxID=7654 RepID=UPI001BB27D7B|nr:uncharacterized protein LOC121414492 [Lytechinus variegatus]